MSDVEKQQQAESATPDNPTVGFVGMRMGVNIGDAYDPIVEKITPEHLTQMFEAAAKDEQAKRKLQSQGQWINLAYVVLALASFVFIVVYLRSDSDLLIRVITITASFIGGIGAGFTLSKKKSND